jgi:tRNA A-37 threonylcarbamoyl transferase component Bud32
MVMPLPDCVITNAAATLWSDPAVPQSLLRGIAANPFKLVRTAAGRPVKIGRESLIVQAEWPVGDRSLLVAVKQYRPRTLGKALTAIFRPAKAMRNWRKAEFLLARAIATPRPLLACRPRGWMASSTSFLVTEWVGGAENLHLFGWRIAARPLAARIRIAARCAEALGRLLGRMHASGAAHRDLKAANLLVVEEGCDAIVYLVDLDGLRPGVRVGFKRQVRDLARLAAGLAAHPWVTRSVCRRFLRAYLRALSSQNIDWKRLWRAIAKETATYIRRKQKRGERVL